MAKSKNQSTASSRKNIRVITNDNTDGVNDMDVVRISALKNKKTDVGYILTPQFSKPRADELQAVISKLEDAISELQDYNTGIRIARGQQLKRALTEESHTVFRDRILESIKDLRTTLDKFGSMVNPS